MKSKKFKSLLPFFLFAVAVIGTYKIIDEIAFFISLIQQVWNIITPFFYGFLLAYVLNIPCGGMQRLLAKTKINFCVRQKKGLSVVLVYILILLMIALVLNLIIPTIASSVTYFIANYNSYYESVMRFIEYLNSWGIFEIEISPDGITHMFQDAVNNLSPENLAASFGALMSVSSAIFKGFLTIISSIYILLEKEKFKVFICRMLAAFLPKEAYEGIVQHTHSLNKNFKQYLHTQTLDGCILGTIVAIELYILGSPYFLILAIMLGVVNYIPYFGSIIGSLVAVVVVCFTQSLTTGAITALVLLVTQQIDGNVIQPKLMGGSFTLSPFLVIASITVGGALAGVFGMIAAIPIVAVLKDIIVSAIEYYEKKKEAA